MELVARLYGSLYHIKAKTTLFGFTVVGKSAGAYAFQELHLLTYAEIGDDIVSIYSAAFDKCMINVR